MGQEHGYSNKAADKEVRVGQVPGEMLLPLLETRLYSQGHKNYQVVI